MYANGKKGGGGGNPLVLRDTWLLIGRYPMPQLQRKAINNCGPLCLPEQIKPLSFSLFPLLSAASFYFLYLCIYTYAFSRFRLLSLYIYTKIRLLLSSYARAIFLFLKLQRTYTNVSRVSLPSRNTEYRKTVKRIVDIYQWPSDDPERPRGM